MEKLCFIIDVLLICLGSYGCGTTQQHRIRQYSQEFQSMLPPIQEKILQGIIEPGYSPLQVYLALGPPNRSSRFFPPPVQPGDQWTYLGIPSAEGFRSSYDGSFLPDKDLQRLTVEFDNSGVTRIHLTPVN